MDPKPASRYFIGEDSVNFVLHFYNMNFLKLNSKAYIYNILAQVRRNEAKERCQMNGGRLAELKNKADVRELKKRLNQEPNANSLWIGGVLNKECAAKPFNESCWYWETENENDEYDLYDPDLIKFTEGSKTVPPPATSGILVVPGQKLQLDFDEGSRLHTFVCDLNPPKTSSAYLVH